MLGEMQFLKKILAKSAEAPSDMWSYCQIATLAVAQILLEGIHTDIACDIKDLKESSIEELKAKKQERIDKANAEGAKKTAEAMEAANKASLHKRQDAMARIEKDKQAAEAAQKQAEAAKTTAEAEKILAEAEAIKETAKTERCKGIAEAKATLINAISRLHQDGGSIVIDSENLQKLLNSHQPSQLEESSSDEKSA